MILFEREMVVAHGQMPSPAPKTNTNSMTYNNIVIYMIVIFYIKVDPF